MRLFGCILIGLCSFGFNTFHEDIQCIGLKVKPRGQARDGRKGSWTGSGVPTSASAGVSSFSSAGGSSAAVPPLFARKKMVDFWCPNCTPIYADETTPPIVPWRIPGTLWFLAANLNAAFFWISTKKITTGTALTWRTRLCWKWKHALSRARFLLRNF